jgi:hypothetical protein
MEIPITMMNNVWFNWVVIGLLAWFVAEDAWQFSNNPGSITDQLLFNLVGKIFCLILALIWLSRLRKSTAADSNHSG